MNGMRLTLYSLAIVTIALSFATGSAAQPPVVGTERTITNVRGDLYLARYDWRATILLVTSDGIVIGDPLSVDAAQWLRGELATRFPGRPVRFVLQSHHHSDRAAGAGVFDGAVAAGHRAFNTELQSARRSSAYADVRPVTRTFETRERISLGGKTVEMIYTGRGHAPGMSALYFPDERVVFAVDPPALLTSPTAWDTSYSPHEVAAWLEAIAPLDFDLLVTGDGSQMSGEAAKTLKPYLDELISSVTAAVQAGRSWSQIRADVVLPSYRNHSHYSAHNSHLERVYRSLKVREWSVYGAGALNRVSATNLYCDGYATCDPFGGMVRGLSAGLVWSAGRYGFVVEGSSEDQRLASRTSRFYDDSLANRRTSGGALFRYLLFQEARVSAHAVGGAWYIVSDTRGLNRIKEAQIPYGGRHDIASRYASPAATAGADLSVDVGPAWAIRVPVRISMGEVGRDDFHAGHIDFRVGIGLGFRLARRVSARPGVEAPVVTRSAPPAGGSKP